MNYELKNFINDNMDLIDENTKEAWEEIYHKLKGEHTGEFTQLMLEAGIDPAMIMGYIPSYYLNHTKIKNYEIPDNATSIGEYAFWGCESLNNVVIPDNVTSIGKDAFWYCRSLTSVEIPNSVTTIGGHALYECDNLTSVMIGDSVTSIGYGAFAYCESLKNVAIPKSATSIGDEAFWCCSELKEVIFKGTKKEAIRCGIGNKSRTRWRRVSSIEKIICTDGEIIL